MHAHYGRFIYADQLHFNFFVIDIFKDLRLIVTNSTSIPNTTVKEFKKILRHGTIATYYGLTEASRSTFMLFDDERRFDSVGRTPDQVEIKINNEKDLEKGEIWIKGLNVIKNYWNDLAADQNFVNGWLKTGDLGRLDKDGYL